MSGKKIGLIMFFCLIILSVFGFQDASYAKTKVLLPKVYQHLDIGVQLAYSGSNWNGRGLAPGTYHEFAANIRFADEIEVIGSYPLLGNEGQFNFNDSNSCSHNIPQGCSFEINYAPYSAKISNITATSSGNNLNWSYGAQLISNQRLGVVATVKKYAKIPNGGELARREIYAPLGGESEIAWRYPQVHIAIEDAIRQALSIDLGNNELTLFYTPIVFRYKKYAQVEDLYADLDAPSSVKKGESYTLSDISRVDSLLTVSEGILEKQSGSGWSEIIRWKGNGKAGTNTGGKTVRTGENIGSDTYRFTIRTVQGQEASCVKTVVVTDGRQVDGKAILEAPKQAYEGHPFDVYDWSEFTVDGNSVSAGTAYKEGFASNSYRAFGGNVRRKGVDAEVIFFKRGIYPVTLQVDLKSGGRLFDTKNVEILKTPFANVKIGGVQKQNRKQIFTAHIATCPAKPIINYELEIEDLTSGEKAKFDKDNLKHEGNSIKTRDLKFEKQNEYFSSLQLEFLTKYPNFYEIGNAPREFSYILKVEDLKGDTDIQHGRFSVRPDLPPSVNINMQDTFIRNAGTNFASITVEDSTKSDGDVFERTWMYAPEHNGGFGEFDALENQAEYKNVAAGTNQKVSFKREGVGKFEIKLHVKEKWIEETLPEFIKPQEYLEGEGKAQSCVVNIAPKVSITPIESAQADLVIVGSESAVEEAKKSETRLQSELIEKGIDANISWLKIRKTDSNSSYYKKIAEIQYTSGLYDMFSNSVYMLSDEDYVYSMSSAVLQTEREYTVCSKPYQLIANNAFTGMQEWSFTVNEDSPVAYMDKNGRYVLISCEAAKKTILLVRKSGQYIGEIPIVIKRGKEIFSGQGGNVLYFVGLEGITAYNIASRLSKKITQSEAYLSRLQNGSLQFVEKKGQYQFYYCSLNLESEELTQIPYPSFDGKFDEIEKENIYEYFSLIPVSMDINGNIVVSGKKMVSSNERYVFSSWYVDMAQRVIKPVFSRYITDVGRIIDVGGVENERGEFTDCYALIVDYDSATNRRRGSYGMYIWDFNGKMHEIYYKRKTAHGETTYMLLAKKDTKNGRYNLLKGADVSSWERIFSRAAAARIDNYKALESAEFAREIPLYPEDYAEHDDYEIFGTWYTKTREDDKSVCVYMPFANDADRFFKIFKKRAMLRRGVSRYVMALDAENFEIAKTGLTNFSETIEMLSVKEINKVAEKLDETLKKPIGMLTLKGKTAGAVSKAVKTLQLDSNKQYFYEYVLYKKADAHDVLRVRRANEVDEKTLCKEIVEKQDFRLPYRDGFVKFNGIMLKGDRYARYTGFGSMAGRWSNNATFSLEFEMEKDGYLACDLFFRFEDKGVYSIVDGNEVLNSGTKLLSTPKYTVVMLKKGKHIVEFRGYSRYRQSCEIGIKNLEIGYYANGSDVVPSSEIRELGNGKFMVMGTFYAPKIPAADIKAAREIATRLELVNESEEEVRISNLRVFTQNRGEPEVEEAEFEEFLSEEEAKDWNVGNQEYGASIIKSKRQAEDMQGELVYKKGQLVRYKINYSDYEADPSKKQCFVYVHTPYNDGENEAAFVIKNLDGSIRKIRNTAAREFTSEEIVKLAEAKPEFVYEKPIERFYVDGKYTVYHWQEDDTTRGKIAGGNPNYDKKSNICEITFYIGGTANAPWVKQISTVPDEVEAGKHFSLNITVDDIEKDELNLITEVYKKGKRVFVHTERGIKADKNGIYGAVDTGIVTSKAESGMYTVVCTVSDATSAGVSKYSFFVVDLKSIKGNIRHTKNWEKNRQKYNAKICKKECNVKMSMADYIAQKKPRERGSNVFWAGEKFVLNAEISGQAVAVSCQMIGTGYKTKLEKTAQNGNSSNFAGVIWNPEMKRKWAGKGPMEFSFEFTAKYEDGDVKTFEEKVIVDDSDEFRKLHRTW